MTVAGALNFVWAFGLFVALGLFLMAERRRVRSSVPGRCRRALAVLVTALVLFPSVSATDDVVRFEELHFRSPSQAQVVSPIPEQSSQKPGLYLARLADALETLQVSAACWLIVILCFFGLVQAASVFGRAVSTITATGRAPPCLPSAIA